LAVTRALIWLRNHQSPSGRWGGDFRAQCKETPCSGVAQLGWVDPGLTGLATLAFLGAGHTHRAGRFKETVKKAIRYLMKVQAPDGLVGGKRGHYMYNHAFCALALTEAYGMTQSPLVKGAAQKAIHWLVKAQNPGMGWR
jgi:squalene cyclase